MKTKALTVASSFLVVIILILIITNFEAPSVKNFSNSTEILPEQIHIAFGDNLQEIVVTWSTRLYAESIVCYGITETETGESEKFLNRGPEKRQQFIHSVKLKNLEPGKIYVYCCGSDLGWSAVYNFTTPPADNQWWFPRLAIFGDLGLKNGRSLPFLQQDTQSGMYDAVVHIGDIGYELDWNNGELGNEFLKSIEPIASFVPYMTCPGNHEYKDNFREYRARFRMPGDRFSMTYSFDMGPVHFISISTEGYYFFKLNGIEPVIMQFNWLKEDLKRATGAESREARPWIVVLGHRPMYCSNCEFDDCLMHNAWTRVGLQLQNQSSYPLEELFHNHTVDLLIWGHEHSYERLWPTYNYKVMNGSRERPYHNPRAPVHITSGSAGCVHGKSTFPEMRPEWSAFRNNDYGYLRMYAYNKTHLYLEQVSVEKDGEVVDSVWITKDFHTPTFY